MVSALGQYILWLHEFARREGRLKIADAEASTILETIARTGPAPKGRAPTEAEQLGLELRIGRPRSERAKHIRRVAVEQLQQPEVLLLAVDELGYSTLILRAILQGHYWRLKEAAAGSIEHAIYIDVQRAMSLASAGTRLVAYMLIAGYGPQEIGAKLQTNGSRRVGKALMELARILRAPGEC